VNEYTAEDLEAFAKGAYNYESRDRHGKGNLKTEYVGTLQRDNRLYDLYSDTGGNYWYILRYMTPEGPVSEYEWIFGHKEPGKKRRRSIK
jgi:hypothetical protein